MGSLRQPSTWDAEALGRQLRPVNASLQRPPKSGGQSLWYRGEERYFDVMLELDERGALTWFQLTVRGFSLTWDKRRDRLLTGRTDELASSTLSPTSKLVHSQRTLDAELIDFARRLLQSRIDEPTLQQALAALVTTATRRASA